MKKENQMNKIYAEEDLKELNDEELLAILTLSWEIDIDQLEVWGELPPLGEKNFGFLRNPHLVSTGQLLHYEPPRVSRRPNFLREYPNEKYLLT